MGITAITGPSVVFGVTRTASGGVQEYNEERGPSLYDAGIALLDPRAEYTYQPGQRVGEITAGWYHGFGLVDAVPGLGTSRSVASAVTPSSGVALTLSTGSSGPITVGVTITLATAPTKTATVLAIDSTFATAPLNNLLYMGQGGTVSIWNPAQIMQRALQFNKSTTDDSGQTYQIKGYDAYGYQINETVTGTASQGSTQFASNKTYKYIQSITPTATSSTTVLSISVADVYGFPLAIHHGGMVDIQFGQSSNIAQMTTKSSFLTFACSITATATTPDVRGTISATGGTPAIVADSSSRLLLRVWPRSVDIQTMCSSATFSSTAAWMLLGTPQWSS